ncbi:hypothetical protein [Sulfitobacter sp. HGT1]|uniref:hypothetical protein n=1 Tax=Sulfitobacter sp. HGT1 TaxID=2735435 RepID=UPI001594A8B1|nr:hypothetical protein [Sulfitobacter sp. HGT1]
MNCVKATAAIATLSAATAFYSPPKTKACLMMVYPDPRSSEPIYDVDVALDAIISMMAEAHRIDMDLSGADFDPALSGLRDEAEQLWHVVASRLWHLARQPLIPVPFAAAARHLFALQRSDGTDSEQDRQHLADLASLARSMAIPGSTRARIAHASFMMSRAFLPPTPFDPIDTPPFSASPTQGF